MIKINSLIIGQGIAGTMVAYMFQQKDISFMVLDSGKINSASRVAAGMFSAISGRRKTFDEEMFRKQKFAIETFKQLEKLLCVNILYEENIYNIIHTEKEKTETLDRTKDEKFNLQIELNPLPIENIKAAFGAIAIKNSGWVNCELMLDTYRSYLATNNSFSIVDFKYDELEIRNGSFYYKDFEAMNIIFCEGYQLQKNPFFENENIIPCKGDIIELKHLNHGNKKILKRNGCFVIPTNDKTVKTGSTYLWNNSDELPNSSDVEELKNKVNDILSNDFKIIAHQSAIRPTTKTREVIAKQHSVFKNMFMLNGLGTKGIIQAPYYANYISELISNKN